MFCVYLDFLFLLEPFFGNMCLSRNFSISLGYPICLYTVFHSILLSFFIFIILLVICLYLSVFLSPLASFFLLKLGVPCDIYRSSYYHPSIILLYSPLAPIPRIVSTGLIFPFTCMCTYFHHIHPTTPFPYILLLVPTPRQELFCLPVLCFCKKWHFCLFKIAIQGVSLWHFHVCMYYNLNWLSPSIFLLFILVAFFWWFQQV
jgi:hypothetical protein